MADYITPVHAGDFSGIEDYNRSHQYPVLARDEFGVEGAQKRYVPFPTVESFRKIACFGLEKLAPEMYPLLTDDFLETYLTSAITELEMANAVSFTPTEFFQSFDWSDDWLSNYSPLRLTKWPAFSVLEMKMKAAHSQTTSPIIEWTFPPQWVALRSNKVNLLADMGVIRTSYRGGDGVAYSPTIQGYTNHRPAAIEVRYKAGFQNGMMPAVVADWIHTVASIRLLSDVTPILFPHSSSSVTIDGVTQSASLPGPQFLALRIQMLEKKQKTIQSAIKGHFGTNIIFDFTFCN
jgi:hypothetical protein